MKTIITEVLWETHDKWQVNIKGREYLKTFLELILSLNPNIENTFENMLYKKDIVFVSIGVQHYLYKLHPKECKVFVEKMEVQTYLKNKK